MKNNQSYSQVQFYRPNQRYEAGYFKVLLVMIQNIIHYRDLIWQLFKRDFFGAYKKSFLGVTWVFLTPLIGILVWVFFRRTGILNPGQVGISYPAYVLVGTSIWGLFMGFYTAASDTLEAGKILVLQVHYPHEVFLSEKILIQLVNFGVMCLVNFGALLALRVIPHWTALLLPFVALPLFFLGISVGLVVALFSAVAIDIQRVMSIGMGLLILITPVIYSDRIQHGWMQTIIQWNPLTYLVCSARDIVLFGRLYHPPLYFLCAAFSLILFFLSLRLFYVSEDKIIERIM